MSGSKDEASNPWMHTQAKHTHDSEKNLVNLKFSVKHLSQRIHSEKYIIG